MTEGLMQHWYTVHTKPNSEYRVAATLQQREIETYLPEMISPRQGRQRQPFFPCYLFMQADLTVVPTWHWQWTPGLRGLVAFDGVPVPLSGQVIALIRRRLDEMEAAGSGLVHPFKPGDTVRITSGPLRDMLAIFDGPTTGSQRVQVFMTFLGRASRVSLDVSELEKAFGAVPAVDLPQRPRRTRGRGRRIHYK